MKVCGVCHTVLNTNRIQIQKEDHFPLCATCEKRQLEGKEKMKAVKLRKGIDRS